MPTTRSLIAGITLALTAISCSDKGPTDVTSTPDPQAPTTAVANRAALLTDVAASGPLFVRNPDGTLTPTGATQSGTFTIKRIDYNQVTGGLEVDGVFKYQHNGATVTQEFRDVPATLKKVGAPTQPTCQILELDIGAIHLDLLGLVVDLAPVHLDIVAQTGPGNLLGNLLCALVGILDGPRLGGFLGAITNLLNQINAILGGL